MLHTRVYIRASIQDVCAYLNMHGGHACTTTCSLVQFNCICRQVAVVLGLRGMGFWDLLGRCLGTYGYCDQGAHYLKYTPITVTPEAPNP